MIGTAGLVTGTKLVRAGAPGAASRGEPFAVGEPPVKFLGWLVAAGTLEEKEVQHKSSVQEVKGNIIETNVSPSD